MQLDIVVAVVQPDKQVIVVKAGHLAQPGAQAELVALVQPVKLVKQGQQASPDHQVAQAQLVKVVI